MALHLSIPAEDRPNTWSSVLQLVSTEAAERLASYCQERGLTPKPVKRSTVIDLLKNYRPKG